MALQALGQMGISNADKLNSLDEYERSLQSPPKPLRTADVRGVALGGAHTAVLLRNDETVEKLSSLMLCGRSYACAQAVGTPIGEHVPTLQPIVHPPKDTVRWG